MNNVFIINYYYFILFIIECDFRNLNIGRKEVKFEELFSVIVIFFLLRG